MNEQQVRAYLEQLERGERINSELIDRLKKNGYIKAVILHDNNGTIASAVYQGLTSCGQSVLNG
jgi:hypothetical protein